VYQGLSQGARYKQFDWTPISTRAEDSCSAGEIHTRTKTKCLLLCDKQTSNSNNCV